MLILSAGAAVAQPIPTGPGSLDGVWQNARYKGTGQGTERDRTIRTTDGQPPPLLPEQAAVLDKRIRDAAAGNLYANTLTACLPGGVPEMLLGAPYGVQVVETPTEVIELFDEQNHFRIIRLNGTHPADPDPSYMGDSIGHWDGDTLVVDTIGLNDKTTLDMVGTPHTEALHVVERYHRTGPDTIQIAITMDDKGAFSKSWQTTAYYRKARGGDAQMSEYICENNRNGPTSAGFQGFQHGSSN